MRYSKYDLNQQLVLTLLKFHIIYAIQNLLVFRFTCNRSTVILNNFLNTFWANLIKNMKITGIRIINMINHFLNGYILGIPFKFNLCFFCSANKFEPPVSQWDAGNVFFSDSVFGPRDKTLNIRLRNLQ